MSHNARHQKDGEIQEARSKEIHRQSIIEQVETRFGSTNLDDDDLFLAICDRLINEGLKLADSDKRHYESIRRERLSKEGHMS